MTLPPEFTRYQRIVIFLFLQERTVPKTIDALERMTGEKYSSPHHIRTIVRRYRNFVKDRATTPAC